MVYFKGSYNWFIDSSYKFVQFGSHVEPCKVSVPFYLWSYNPKEGPKVVDEGRECRKTTVVKLNGFSVKLSKGYHGGEISFLKRGESPITVAASPVIMSTTRSGGSHYTDTKAVDYHIRVKGKTVTHHTRIDPQAFEFVNEYGHYDIRGKCVDNFNYGVAPFQYLIMYKNKVLNGESYALFCGPWGILLDDDLSFDSLILMEGKSADVIAIEKFVYTVNPYITKVMMLMK